MPIVDYQKNARMPVIGKIRLGERKTSSGGKEYPSETPHFVLKDAPEVAKVYGDQPTAIDVLFTSDDMEEVMPYWYKWYAGGVRDKDGNMVGGKLQCYGDGQTAHHLAKRDPVTRVVPTRQCLGEACPDWKSAGGLQQCKPAMSVYVLLPRVSLLGIYQIDTTSKIAIQRFVSQVGMIHSTWKRLKGIPFTLFREPTATSFIDEKGKSQNRVHYILSIKPNESFFETHGVEFKQKVSGLLSGGVVFANSKQELIEAPMEDNFGSAPGQAAAPEAPKTAGIEVVAEDPEFSGLFDQLCKLKGKQNTAKIRLITARQFEKAADPKMSLLNYLNSQIAELSAKQQTPSTPDPTPPPAAQGQAHPQANSDGLI